MFKNITKDTFKDTLKMAWPSVVEFFFAALATIIDSLMVSGLGKEAVAAVGLTSQPILLRLSFFTAINIALSALIARRKGEKQPKTANRILITALLMTVILAIVISGVFSHHSREEYKDIIERLGGKNVGSISGKTSFVLAGSNMGPSKLEKAQKLGIEIKNEEEFLKLIENDL